MAKHTHKSALIKLGLLSLVVLGVYLIPQNSQFVYGYGESDGRSDGRSSSPTPQCNGARPNAPIVYEPGNALLPRATGVGEVRLNWLRTQNASGYGVGIGLTPGNYIYGSPNIGDTTNFTVRFLTPGRRYYFAVRANNGCTPGPWSREWLYVIGGGSGNTGGTTFTQTRATQPLPIQNTRLVSPTPVQRVTQTVLPTRVPTAIPTVRQQTALPTQTPVAPQTNQGGGFFDFFTKLFGG